MLNGSSKNTTMHVILEDKLRSNYKQHTSTEQEYHIIDSITHENEAYSLIIKQSKFNFEK